MLGFFVLKLELKELIKAIHKQYFNVSWGLYRLRTRKAQENFFIAADTILYLLDQLKKRFLELYLEEL